jgi:predicted nucleic acid-binding protein
MRIFLDTSILSDTDLYGLTSKVLERFVKGDQFCISSISHFEIERGYTLAHRAPDKYHDFLNGFHIEVAPLTKSDAEEAAKTRSADSQILDALIAACVKRYAATLWTADKDYSKFLTKSNLRLFR